MSESGETSVAIALHFFCSETQNEHRFLQHYLGHLLEEQKGFPNATATQHYFHYRLLDTDGKILTARGILILNNGLPPAIVEETSIAPALNSDVESQLLSEEMKSMLSLNQNVEESLAPPSNEDVEEMDATLVSSPEAITNEKSAKPALNSRHHSEVPNLSLCKTQTPSEEKPTMLDELSFSIPERDQTRWLSVLDQICPGARSPEQKITALLSWVEQHFKDSPGRTSEDLNAHNPSPNPDALGKEGSSFDSTTLPNAVVNALTDQAKVSAWLTNRLDSLELELAELKLARSSLKEQLSAKEPHDDATETLTRENQFLKQELAQEKTKLDSLRQLLNGSYQDVKDTPKEPKTLPPHAAARETVASLPNKPPSTAPIQKQKSPAPAKRTGKANARALKIFSALQQ